MIQITDKDDNVVCTAESIEAMPQAILDHFGIEGVVVPYELYTNALVNSFHGDQQTYIREDDDDSWQLWTWVDGESKETWFRAE